MALIDCTECGKQVSDKASACPNCGAPIELPAAKPSDISAGTAAAEKETKSPSIKKKKSLIASIVTAALIAGGIYIYYKVSTGSSVRSAITGPETIVSERIPLKEGEAMSYNFTLPSQRRVEVNVRANPKKVNVMLMTVSEWSKFKKVKGSLFGGNYTYRKALSRESILSMNESEILPAGRWYIIVERPSESILFGDSTKATIKIIGH